MVERGVYGMVKACIKGTSIVVEVLGINWDSRTISTYNSNSYPHFEDYDFNKLVFIEGGENL